MPEDPAAVALCRSELAAAQERIMVLEDSSEQLMRTESEIADQLRRSEAEVHSQSSLSG